VLIIDKSLQKITCFVEKLLHYLPCLVASIVLVVAPILINMN
jgi:hypothetical protein